MRLILSRKGFDSAAGGCPSPILPDGRLLSLPIPDARSSIDYRDTRFDQQPLSKWVNNLTGKPRMARQGAHLDPDIRTDALASRHQAWRGVLGQHGSAQSHLVNEGVQTGDLFLFFGLFRPVEMHKRRWRFVPGSPPRHIIWGWLQIERMVSIDTLTPQELPWARYHPHFRYAEDPLNTLYLATDTLNIAGSQTGTAGFGTFSHRHPELTLTDPESRQPSRWRLPRAFYPTADEPALSYHRNPDRWTEAETGCHLQAAARGQEFVLGPKATGTVQPWLNQLFGLP